MNLELKIAATKEQVTVGDTADPAIAVEASANASAVVLRGADDLATLPDDMFTAGFIKPQDSQAFFAEFGVKACRVASREDAVAQVNHATEHGLAVMLQEYVPGPSDRHYLIDGYRDRAGAVRTLFARRRLRMEPPDFGNSSCMLSVPLAEVV